jgi:hypothetical protein
MTYNLIMRHFVAKAVEIRDIVLVCAFSMRTVMNKACLQDSISVTTVSMYEELHKLSFKFYSV